MIKTIFTDPHLGTRRAAHTTRSSADALRQSLYWQAMSIVNGSPHPKLCVGDLFDKAQNDEATLVQGFNVASQCEMTLSGNHDELNREGVVTSLQALKDMGVPICSAPDLSKPYFTADGAIYMVPHHASNELFIEACLLAAQHASVNRDGQASYLFLHCNYNFPMKLEDNTLNLPEDIAVDLGQAFDFIFIGHEHNPSEHLDGKVIILGNTHPTSFSDISDKFIYHLEVETAELTKERVWSMDNSYRQLKLGDDIPDLEGVQFVEVIGTDKAENAGAWKASFYKPEGEDNMISDLFAVRNKVDVVDALSDVDTDIGSVSVDNLKDTIAKELAGTDLLPIYQALVAEVSA